MAHTTTQPKAPYRLSQLEVDDSAWLRLTREDQLIFVTVVAIPDPDHVTFVSVAEDGLSGGTWTAYRYRGRWAYGTSADRLVFVGFVPAEAVLAESDDQGPF